MNRRTLVGLFILLIVIVGCGDNTPRPAPPAPSSLTILSHSSYIYINVLVIVGEVINNTESNQGIVEITASLYNESNSVIGTMTEYAAVDVLKPGQRSPFTFVIYSEDMPAHYDHYALHLEGFETTEEPLEGFVLVGQGDRLSEYNDWRYIYGEVRNDTGVEVHFVNVLVTLYNAEGGVVNTAYGYLEDTTLAPGQRSRFEILVESWNGATRYEFYLQEDQG
jgi:hypothetical protein